LKIAIYLKTANPPEVFKVGDFEMKTDAFHTFIQDYRSYIEKGEPKSGVYDYYPDEEKIRSFVLAFDSVAFIG
jgi:hypothetical protein